MHRRGLLTFAGAGALLLTSAVGGLNVSAQDATPAAAGMTAHPLHIHSGNCDELGEVVAPLTDLTAPEGDRVGQRNRASQGVTSFTSVPLTLDAILAEDHAINAHLSADQIDVYIACGELGGVMAPDGSLTIGLRELNDSGYTGIAYLAPGADGASTDVTVFLAETGNGERGGDNANMSASDDDATMDEDMAGDDSVATPDAMEGMDMGGESTPNP
ncbi:MAG: hypothetical protein M3Z20_14365 [Chloroflexota bacterium]|nr:hypothetical protein [Chloroflexota bacterium]